VARYRKVEVATWFDDRFQSLSAPQPCAQFLWLYLLSGPRTTSFPGLLVGREEVMAADLRWPIGPFREASAKGLVKADWKAGLVVLRKALLDSTGEPRDTAKPESPNVIKSWAKSWEEIPDCPLKAEYLRSLESFTKGLGEAYHQAFREGFRKALVKASTHPSLNQDQDQEQKQEQDIKNSAAPTASGSQFEILKSKVDAVAGEVGSRRARKPKPSDHTAAECESVRVVLEKLSAQNGVRYSGTAEHARLIVNQLRAGVDEMDLRAVIGYCALELNGGWKGNPDMEQFLRPETLFGPKTISKYLDPARTWFAKLQPSEPTSPVVDAEVEPHWMQDGGAA
jgi:uncharacterized phage protein (TIGR02220 family)